MYPGVSDLSKDMEIRSANTSNADLREEYRTENQSNKRMRQKKADSLLKSLKRALSLQFAR